MSGTYPYQYNGKYPVKSKAPGRWLTKIQLLRIGRIVLDGEKPCVMYCNNTYEKKAEYYNVDTQTALSGDAAKMLKDMKIERKKKSKIRDEAMLLFTEETASWNTSYRWLGMGRIPKANAKWKRGGHDLLSPKIANVLPGWEIGSSNYFYCHIDDTYEACIEELKKVCIDQRFLYNKNPDKYDGRMLK